LLRRKSPLLLAMPSKKDRLELEMQIIKEGHQQLNLSPAVGGRLKATFFISVAMRVAFCSSGFLELSGRSVVLKRHRRMLEKVMKRQAPPTPVELVVAPAAIERALGVYGQLHPRDPSVILQAERFSHSIFSEWSIGVSMTSNG
jgi:hypothetical protein